MRNTIVQPLYITTVIKFSLLTINLLRMSNKKTLKEVFKCIIRTCQKDDLHLSKGHIIAVRKTHVMKNMRRFIIVHHPQRVKVRSRYPKAERLQNLF